jgi:predicted DNA-binding transcriptional regulator AlpA
MDGRELLTLTEAADMVRVPAATLRYWRHLGDGPRGFRIGRRVMFRRGEIEAWLVEQERKEHSV